MARWIVTTAEGGTPVTADDRDGARAAYLLEHPNAEIVSVRAFQATRDAAPVCAFCGSSTLPFWLTDDYRLVCAECRSERRVKTPYELPSVRP